MISRYFESGVEMNSPLIPWFVFATAIPLPAATARPR